MMRERERDWLKGDFLLSKRDRTQSPSADAKRSEDELKSAGRDLQPEARICFLIAIYEIVCVILIRWLHASH